MTLAFHPAIMGRQPKPPDKGARRIPTGSDLVWSKARRSTLSSGLVGVKAFGSDLTRCVSKVPKFIRPYPVGPNH